jgi:hypothetical protein
MKRTFLAVIFIFFFSLNAWPLDSVDLFSGYLRAKLDEEETFYEAVPFLVSFNYEASRFFRRTESPFMNLSVEPFFSVLKTPERNTETGANFLLKCVFTQKKLFQPYIKAGIGLVYITQETKNQREGFNFLPQAGLGFSFRITENTSASLEYRFRHLSNAGLRKPNSGIDADMFLIGIQFRL